MSQKPTLKTEPATLTTALTAAIVATVNVLGILFDWSADLIAGLNIAAAAWVGVLGFIIRARVSPVLDFGDASRADAHDDSLRAGQ